MGKTAGSDDLPRYARCTGTPPRHLASIHRERGELCFDGGGHPKRRINIGSGAEQDRLLAWLVAERVPVASDQRIDGPAERAMRLADAGRITGPVIELSWHGPGAWQLRERCPGAVEWVEAPAVEFACLDFDSSLIEADT